MNETVARMLAEEILHIENPKYQGDDLGYILQQGIGVIFSKKESASATLEKQIEALEEELESDLDTNTDLELALAKQKKLSEELEELRPIKEALFDIDYSSASTEARIHAFAFFGASLDFEGNTYVLEYARYLRNFMKKYCNEVVELQNNSANKLSGSVYKNIREKLDACVTKIFPGVHISKADAVTIMFDTITVSIDRDKSLNVKDYKIGVSNTETVARTIAKIALARKEGKMMAMQADKDSESK